MYFTIAICTYNNAVSLRKTLESLLNLKSLPDDQYEILVILNNCSDNSRSVVDAFQVSSDHATLRVVEEFEQGLSVARNTALRASKGDIVCFLDDDVVVDPGWLQAVSEAFSLYGADVVGGRSYLLFPSSLPDWFVEDYEPFLSKLDYGSEVLEDTILELYGLNFSVTKDIVGKVGYFDVKLGRNGNLLMSGEEKDFQQRVIASGGKCVYMPSAVVGHVVPETRMTKQWFLKRSYFKGYSPDAVNCGLSLCQVLCILIRCFFGLIKSYLMQDCNSSKWFNKQMVLAEFFGKFVYLIRFDVFERCKRLL